MSYKKQEMLTLHDHVGIPETLFRAQLSPITYYSIQSKYKSRLELLSKEIASRLLSDIQMDVCMVVEVKIYHITRGFLCFFFIFLGEGGATILPCGSS